MTNMAALRAAWTPRVLSCCGSWSVALYAAWPQQNPGRSAGGEPTALRADDVDAGLAGILELAGGFLVTVGCSPDRRVHPVRRNGIRLFHVACAAGFFPYSNGGSLAVLYCFVFFYLAFAGGGPWALDRLRSGSGS